MVGLGGFGETLEDEGQTEMEQWSFLQVSMKQGLALLVSWQTLPLSQPQSRGGGGGGRNLLFMQHTLLLQTTLVPFGIGKAVGSATAGYCLLCLHSKLALSVLNGAAQRMRVFTGAPVYKLPHQLHQLRQAPMVPVTISLSLQAYPLQSVFLIF